MHIYRWWYLIRLFKKHVMNNVLLNGLFCAICLIYILTRSTCIDLFSATKYVKCNDLTILWVFTDIYIFHIWRRSHENLSSFTKQRFSVLRDEKVTVYICMHTREDMSKSNIIRPTTANSYQIVVCMKFNSEAIDKMYGFKHFYINVWCAVK